MATLVLVDSATAAGVAACLPVPDGCEIVRVPGDRAAYLLPVASSLPSDAHTSLVIWVGGSDLRTGRPIADIVHHVAETVDHSATARPDCAVTIAAVPHGRGRWAGAVATLNAELARVARERNVAWFDPRLGRSDDRGRSLPSWTTRSGRIRV